MSSADERETGVRIAEMRSGCDRVPKDDVLAVEEPMEIRVAFSAGERRSAPSSGGAPRSAGRAPARLGHG